MSKKQNNLITTGKIYFTPKHRTPIRGVAHLTSTYETGVFNTTPPPPPPNFPNPKQITKVLIFHLNL